MCDTPERSRTLSRMLRLPSESRIGIGGLSAIATSPKLTLPFEIWLLPILLMLTISLL